MKESLQRSEDRVALKIGIKAGCREAVGLAPRCALAFYECREVRLGGMWSFVADGEVLKIQAEKTTTHSLTLLN